MAHARAVRKRKRHTDDTPNEAARPSHAVSGAASEAAPSHAEQTERQKGLRLELLAIQQLDLPPEEKAKKMQALMMRGAKVAGAAGQ